MALPRTQDRSDLAATVTRARAGDAGAFEDLVRRYSDPLMGYLTHLVQADAEDLAQEAFWKAHGSLADLKEPQAFAGWLFAIARNLALAEIARRRRPAPPAPEASPAPDARVEGEQRAEALAAALAQVPTDARDLLLLRYWAGLPAETIAGLTDSTADRTRARLGYARKLLRDELLKRGGW